MDTCWSTANVEVEKMNYGNTLIFHSAFLLQSRLPPELELETETISLSLNLWVNFHWSQIASSSSPGSLMH